MSALSNWRRKDWKDLIPSSESRSIAPPVSTTAASIFSPFATPSDQTNSSIEPKCNTDPLEEDRRLGPSDNIDTLAEGAQRNPWNSSSNSASDRILSTLKSSRKVTPAISSSPFPEPSSTSSSSMPRFSSPPTSVASLYASLAQSPEEAFYPYSFPFVALTRADERSLVNLLMMFKTANDRFQSSPSALAMSADSWKNGVPEINSNLPLDAVVPEQNRSAQPFLLLSQLFLEDFPAEVLLSCPQILSHLLSGISQAESDAPAASLAVFSAASSALFILLNKLNDSLLR
jgi:hypothetical protein